MPREDAFFRTLQPVAETLVARCRREGRRIDPRELAEEVLRESRAVIHFGPYEPSLRARLQAHIGELNARASG